MKKCPFCREENGPRALTCKKCEKPFLQIRTGDDWKESTGLYPRQGSQDPLDGHVGKGQLSHVDVPVLLSRAPEVVQEEEPPLKTDPPAPPVDHVRQSPPSGTSSALPDFAAGVTPERGLLLMWPNEVPPRIVHLPKEHAFVVEWVLTGKTVNKVG